MLTPFQRKGVGAKRRGDVLRIAKSQPPHRASRAVPHAPSFLWKGEDWNGSD